MRLLSPAAALLLTLALACPVWGQDTTATALEPFPMQTNPMGARAAALGGAMTGVTNDASALACNSAIAATLESTSLALHHYSGPLGVNQEAITLGLPLSPGLGGLGLGFDFIDHGAFVGRNDNGERTQDFSVREARLAADWGASPVRGFSLGVGTRLTQQYIAGEQSVGLAASLGGLCRPWPWMGIGGSVQALGGTGAEATRCWQNQLGVSSSMDDPWGGRFMVAFGGGFHTLDEYDWRLGGEYLFRGALALRLGYHQPLSRTLEPRESPLPSVGVGGGWQGLWLDYAWLPSADFEPAHRLSLTATWGPRREPPAFVSLLKQPLQGLRARAGAAKAALAPTPTSAFSGTVVKIVESGGAPPTPSVTATSSPTPSPSATALAGEPLGALAPPPQLPETRPTPGMVYQVLSDAAVLGDALFEVERDGDALEAYQQGLNDNPADTACWRGLARVYTRNRRLDWARTCWRNVLRLSPNDDEAQRALKSD